MWLFVPKFTQPISSVPPSKNKHAQNPAIYRVFSEEQEFVEYKLKEVVVFAVPRAPVPPPNSLIMAKIHGISQK
jgi:hypothetical protein